MSKLTPSIRAAASSPLTAVIIGFMGCAAWYYSQNHNTPDPTATTTTAKAVARRPAPLALPLPAPASAETQVSTTRYSPAARKHLQGLLNEIADGLDKKARPALDNEAHLLNLFARRPGAEVLSEFTLTSAARDLGDVQSSLERIRSGNREFSGELNAVIGDTTALSSLVSALQVFNDSLATTPTDEDGLARLREAAAGPRTYTGMVDQWIDGCQQRIAGLRATIGDSN